MKHYVERFLTGIFVIFILGSLAGMLLDRPVFASYVYSGSMSPTLNRGDLFFINPLARDPDVGDVVVFRLGEKWTVHRVVAEVNGGYVTKGDANAGTDQMNGAPLITKRDIAGKVLTLNGKPLKVRGVEGYLNSGGNIKLFLSVLMIVLGVILFTSGEEKIRRSRKRHYLKIKFKSLYMLFAVFFLIMLSISMFLSWKVIPVEYAVTEAGSVREGWYAPGEDFSMTVTVKNGNFYPMVYYITTAGHITNGEVRPFSLSSGEERKLTFFIDTPQETALYRDSVKVYGYMPLLPGSVMELLYSISPRLPVFALLLESTFLLWLMYLASGIGKSDSIRVRIRPSRLKKLKLGGFRL